MTTTDAYSWIHITTNARHMKGTLDSLGQSLHIGSMNKVRFDTFLTTEYERFMATMERIKPHQSMSFQQWKELCHRIQRLTDVLLDMFESMEADSRSRNSSMSTTYLCRIGRMYNELTIKMQAHIPNEALRLLGYLPEEEEEKP